MRLSNIGTLLAVRFQRCDCGIRLENLEIREILFFFDPGMKVLRAFLFRLNFALGAGAVLWGFEKIRFRVL